MEITLLVKVIMGLIVMAGILLFLLFYIPKEDEEEVAPMKKAKKNRDVSCSVKTDLNSLLSIIKNKASTTQELKEALEMVLKYHGEIHKKLGLRPHPEFDVYSEILIRICRHPNTHKEIIVNFDKELVKKNEEYRKDIFEFVSKGLNSRGL